MNNFKIDIVFISGFALGCLVSDYEDSREAIFMLGIIGIRITVWLF